MRPKKKNPARSRAGQRLVTACICLPPDMLRALKTLAVDDRRSLSMTVRILIEEALKPGGRRRKRQLVK